MRLLYIRPISCNKNLPYRILYLYFTLWNIKKTEFYLEGGLLHEIGLIYTTSNLHHRKCFVRILFTRCKTLETHSFATLTLSFLKFCDSWIKIRTAHFLWSNLFLHDCFSPFFFFCFARKMPGDNSRNARFICSTDLTFKPLSLFPYVVTFFLFYNIFKCALSVKSKCSCCCCEKCALWSTQSVD